MKRMILVFLAVLMVPVFGQQNYTFTELSGLQTNVGDTVLIYRKYRHFSSGNATATYNHIYLWNLTTGADSLFLEDYSSDDPFMGSRGKGVTSLGFRNNDPQQYVAGGHLSYWFATENDRSPSPVVFLPDSIVPILWIGYVDIIRVSRQNPYLVYGSVGGNFMKSTDGGHHWDFDYNNPFQKALVEISPFNDQVVFGFDWDNGLQKSTDGGVTFTAINDTNATKEFRRIAFDKDEQHLYAVALNDAPSRNEFLRSTDFGDSWEFMTPLPVYYSFIADPTVSGRVYRIPKNSNIIEYSDDYAQTFSELVHFPETVTGFYKLPNSETYFATTTTKLYQIAPGDTVLLRDLQAVGIGEPPASVAEGFALHQNYPNPFNPSTTIAFDLPKSAEIELAIFDIAGRKVATVAAGKYAAGSHSLNFDAAHLASGVYFYQLRAANGLRLSRKMLVLK